MVWIIEQNRYGILLTLNGYDATVLVNTDKGTEKLYLTRDEFEFIEDHAIEYKEWEDDEFE